MPSDQGKWHAVVTVHKYDAKGRLFEIRRQEGNLLLNEGINCIWNIICGNGSETVYSNANARLGVGDSATAAQATDTGLLGTSTWKAMDATYPTSGTSQKATFKATFGPADANYAWNEWSIDNGSTPNKNLNRKAPAALGTKNSPETWILTVDVTLA